MRADPLPVRASPALGRDSLLPIRHYIAIVRRVMSSVRRPADIARRSAKALAGRESPRDGFRRETSRCRARPRKRAREMFRRFPKAAYMTEIRPGACCPAIASNSRCGGFPARIERARSAHGATGCRTTAG